jgi:uncharacterized protein (TIGR02246 family)
VRAASTRDFAYPTNHVVGTVTDAAKAHAAIDALLRAGFDRRDIDILHSEEDLHRLDPTGAAHGFLAQFHRTLIRTFELQEHQHLLHHIEDIRAGRYVIMVLTKRRVQKIAAADILHRYGAEFVGFYGRWAWQELPPSDQTSPEDVPAAFVRAWNDRDADALAALFDPDAEFVSVEGLCWHDRESIRKAYAARLDGALANATMSNGETKIKLLSPEVAVVYAHMTVSGEPPGQTATVPARETIFSFVVHRTGDHRWRCASAHYTDVLPTAASAVGEAR